MTFSGLILQGMFLLIGLASMVTINQSFHYILNRVNTVNIELYNEMIKTKRERAIVTLICIAIGGVFAGITMHMSIE